MLTNSDPGGFWDGILFINRLYGLIYGDPTDEGHLLVTHDSGTTWTEANLPAEPFFAASNSSMGAYGEQIWAGTGRAQVLRRKPGEEWKAFPTPLASGNDSSGVFSVAFRDPEHGIAGDYRKPEVTSGTAAFSSGGGAHWSAAGKAPHGFRSAGLGFNRSGLDNGRYQWLRCFLRRWSNLAMAR